MPLYADIPGVTIQVSRNVVVASTQIDLQDDVLARFREDLLGRIHETGSSGVILDISGLEILDSSEFVALRRIITMTTVMGEQSVLVGLRQGVVSGLVEAGADVDGLRTAIDLDAAYRLLHDAINAFPNRTGQEEDRNRTSFDALFIWSTIHGLSSILRSHTVDTLGMDQQLLDAAIPETLARIGPALAAPPEVTTASAGEDQDQQPRS